MRRVMRGTLGVVLECFKKVFFVGFSWDFLGVSRSLEFFVGVFVVFCSPGFHGWEEIDLGRRVFFFWFGFGNSVGRTKREILSSG